MMDENERKDRIIFYFFLAPVSLIISDLLIKK